MKTTQSSTPVTISFTRKFNKGALAGLTHADEEVADIQAAIEAATTLDELVQIVEERVYRIDAVSPSPVYLLVRGQLLNRVSTRATALLDGRSGS